MLKFFKKTLRLVAILSVSFNLEAKTAQDGDLIFEELQSITSKWSKQVKVSPGELYKLSFEARITLDSFQLSQYARTIFEFRNQQVLPSWARWALTSYWTYVPWGHAQLGQCIHSKEWKPYVDTFYAPTRASKLVVEFKPAELPFEVRNVRLEQMPRPEILNPNHDFSGGPFDMNGYNNSDKAEVKEDSNSAGSYYLDATNGWAVLDQIPVNTENSYILNFKVRATNGSLLPDVNLTYVNEDGEDMFNVVGGKNDFSVRLRLTGVSLGDENWNEEDYTFVPPEDAKFIKIFVGFGQFKNIALSVVK